MEDLNQSNIAINILSDKINNLLNTYSNLDETQIKNERIQEKIETLSEVRNQIYLGNNTMVDRIIKQYNIGKL